MPEADGASEVLAPAPEAAGPARRRVTLGGGRLFERTSVIDGIVAEIRAKIVAGELKDGDALPSQDEMARALGVSRASLREALHRLVLMGLVEMRHGSGTFVRTARPQDLMNSLSSLLILDRSSAAELLEARFHVESALAALAAMNATEEDLERIARLIERIEAHWEHLDIDSYMPLDTQLHLAFAQASHNPVLVKVLEILWDVLPRRIRHITATEQIPDYLAFHRAIYAAIASRDPAAARREIERHVEYLIRVNQQAEVFASRAAPAGAVAGSAATEPLRSASHLPPGSGLSAGAGESPSQMR